LWTPFRKPEHTRIQELERTVEDQQRLIHQLQTALAQALGQPLPAPLPPHSRPPLPRSGAPARIRGAEDVSVLDRAQRREQELKAAVEAVPLPEYMRNPRPPTGPLPEGKNVGGGFSPLSDPPPSPAPDEPSTTS
jgi:hypothetical protein